MKVDFFPPALQTFHSAKLLRPRLSQFSLSALVVCCVISGNNLPAQNAIAAIGSSHVAGNAQPVSSLNESDSSYAATPQNAPQAAPSQPAQQSAPDDQQGAQTKRILGLIPNFRAVSAGEKLPPQSVKDKFLTATEDSFDYSSVFIPGIVAGYSMARNATPEFHQGAAGYGRYFWHAAVDQTSENYMVEFIVPAIAHQDTRFYTLGSGGFLKRTGYALSRVVITRSDSGNEVFNASEIIGAGASSGLSSLYYPSRQRSFGNTGEEWGLDVGIDAASFFVKEFWPDINRHIFHAGQSADSVETDNKTSNSVLNK